MIDICWLFSSLLVGIATAAIFGQMFYMMAQSNTTVANYVVAGTLLAGAILSVLVRPGPDDYTGDYVTLDNNNATTNHSPAVAPPQATRGASPEQLRKAQENFMSAELSENLRITEGLNRAFITSQRMHAGTTSTDLADKLQAFSAKESLLIDFRSHVDTQNERLRRALLDAGASPDQANQIAIAFANKQASVNRQNEIMYKNWREVFDLTKQTLTILRDNPGHWRFDDDRGAVMFSNESTMKQFGPLQDKLQSLLDEAR